MTETERSEDMKPHENPPLDEKFADPINKTYPIITESQIRAAWRYINNTDNTSQYDNNELEVIKQRIIQAAQKYNIDLDSEN
jgi:hypothetical protein